MEILLQLFILLLFFINWVSLYLIAVIPNIVLFCITLVYQFSTISLLWSINISLLLVFLHGFFHLIVIICSILHIVFLLIILLSGLNLLLVDILDPLWNLIICNDRKQFIKILLFQPFPWFFIFCWFVRIEYLSLFPCDRCERNVNIMILFLWIYLFCFVDLTQLLLLGI